MGSKKINQKSKSIGNLRRGMESHESNKKDSLEKLSPQMASLTKDQLKSELKKRGLKITGTKNELVWIKAKLFIHSQFQNLALLFLLYFIYLFY